MIFDRARTAFVHLFKIPYGAKVTPDQARFAVELSECARDLHGPNSLPAAMGRDVAAAARAGSLDRVTLAYLRASLERLKAGREERPGESVRDYAQQLMRGRRTEDLRFAMGFHRVVEPQGLLPQAARVLNASLPLQRHEALIDVDVLNVDSSSHRDLLEEEGRSGVSVGDQIMGYVGRHGKQQNPRLGSGGMLIGRLRERTDDYTGPLCQAQPGDKVATLVSLTLTPLHLKSLGDDRRDQIEAVGHALLFSSGPAALLPDETDIGHRSALAALDIAGAAPWLAHYIELHQPKNILLLGGGKTAMMLGAAVQFGLPRRMKRPEVFCVDRDSDAVRRMQDGKLANQVAICDATQPLQIMEAVMAWTHGLGADMVVNITNAKNVEPAAYLAVAAGGQVFYFSTATNFTRAALGAEGVGVTGDLLIGNGYFPSNATYTLQLLRAAHHDGQISDFRKMFDRTYGV